ncbi:MAG: gamma carbonic anhydrase family protein [Bdellovibrio sp. CG10_big_fil_rev_8_21_14_0_10_47_8]|nr:MAG: gamma carbonic anhydrase family protein [Bdellovibrio sp. CG10_big_fil_rev_8_21_14_0_10_47_8]
MKAQLITVRGATPQIGKDCFLASNATLIGDVQIGDGSSIWYQTTLRGDVNSIRIGKETNVQDGTVIHGTYQGFATFLGDRVTIGHMVVLHGCTVGSGSLVGMGSIVMDGAEIGEHCLVGAGSLVTEGSKFPPRSLILGRPAKVKRELTAEEIDLLEESADNYLLYKSWY